MTSHIHNLSICVLTIAGQRHPGTTYRSLPPGKPSRCTGRMIRLEVYLYVARADARLKAGGGHKPRTDPTREKRTVKTSAGRPHELCVPVNKACTEAQHSFQFLQRRRRHPAIDFRSTSPLDAGPFSNFKAVDTAYYYPRNGVLISFNFGDSEASVIIIMLSPVPKDNTSANHSVHVIHKIDLIDSQLIGLVWVNIWFIGPNTLREVLSKCEDLR
ncbi:hypothetical protein BD309DRAFT_979798 [Dichomitus squalens]|uniref:Uncharacterized protein n=1 Tax=Dichomitus squalens TaxID=114155 RepID=A0A4Q9PNW3_9APHY|nr:hypothetical protein BD309DRAFT_979798 [Dichomitus squalens]TBU55977.1 hypothetical protein BD310DRAFT_908003 [Dichomitus squalens]